MKKFFAVCMAMAIMMLMFTACGKTEKVSETTASAVQSMAQSETQVASSPVQSESEETDEDGYPKIDSMRGLSDPETGITLSDDEDPVVNLAWNDGWYRILELTYTDGTAYELLQTKSGKIYLFTPWDCLDKRSDPDWQKTHLD